MSSPVIPLHSLQARTKLGLEIRRVVSVGSEDVTLMSAHRDDHYIFIFQETGNSHIMVDFKDIYASASAILCILPGQVHHSVSTQDISGWFLAIDPALIIPPYRELFEEFSLPHSPIQLDPTITESLKKQMEALHREYTSSSLFHFSSQIIQNLANACIGIFASLYYQQEQEDVSSNPRPYIITRQFRGLLFRNFRTMKSPAEYAAALHLTPAYLSESVKQITGQPVTYWIHQEIIMEAKRLLYYTNMTAKEIAYALGYEDHTYFTRLFSKIAEISPIQFRQLYRK